MVYTLFDGVGIVAGSVNAPEASPVPGPKPSSDMLLVCHCRLGSLQLLAADALLAELSEGKVVVVRADEATLSCRMPLGFYQGAAVWVDLRSMGLSTRHGMTEFGIDPRALTGLVGPGGSTEPERTIDLSHTFSELYNLLQAPAPNLGYLRLKAFELLLLLQKDGPHGGQEGSTRAASSLFVGRAQTVYRAEQVMTRRVSNPIGITELARACEVSPSALKDAFREACGMPVGTWYRSYRIHRACDMLREENISIREVASAVGYASASKFSQAFAQVLGMRPSEWRRVNGVGSTPGGSRSHAARRRDQVCIRPDGVAATPDQKES